MSKKTDKIEMRVEPWDKAVIRQKAEVLNLSISEFMLRCALARELPPPPNSEQMQAYLLLQDFKGKFIRIGNLFRKGNYPMMMDRITDLIEKIDKHLDIIENGWKGS